MVQEDWNEETGFAWVEQRNKFSVGEEIEVMPAQGDSYAMKVTEIRNQNGETVASAPHPQELLQVNRKTEREEVLVERCHRVQFLLFRMVQQDL